MSTASDETGKNGTSIELARAIEAATQADLERGRALAALAELEHLAAALHLAQAEWDILLAEHIEESRLLIEQVKQLERQLDAMTESTSWRVLQKMLAPYRLLMRRG